MNSKLYPMSYLWGICFIYVTYNTELSSSFKWLAEFLKIILEIIIKQQIAKIISRRNYTTYRLIGTNQDKVLFESLSESYHSYMTIIIWRAIDY